MNGLTRKLLVFVLAMGALAAAGWFGRKAYKGASEARLISQAVQFSRTNDYRKAELCLRRVLQINPTSVPAIRMVADMLEAAGLPAALNWRIQAAQLQAANVTNRLDWAQTALKFGELKSAEEALGEIKGKETGSAAYRKLSGALAWFKHEPLAAESNYLAALQLEPSNTLIVLNLDTIRLGSTNQDTAQAARKSLEHLVDSSGYRVNALHILEQDAVARKSWPEALSFSKQLATEHAAGFGDKLGYLQLLKVCTNAQFAPWCESLKQEATNSAVQAFAFGRWMAKAKGPSAALVWLHTLPVELQTNQPVPLIITDCQIALKDWPGLIALVDKQDWTEAEFYRYALHALAYRSLGKEFPSQAAWRDALRHCAHRLDRFSRLGQVTAGWGWNAENTEVLEKITSEFPKEKWAATSLMAQLYSAGNTRELTDFLKKRYATDPTDVLVKNNLANLYLLRKSDLDKAYRLAREAHTMAPKDPFFTSTYAYSLLLQNKTDEAVHAVSELKADYLQIPSVAAYYGVIQAESGHKELARAALKRADGAKLLPEETELVRLAKAHL